MICCFKAPYTDSNYKRDLARMNVTFRCVRETVAAVEKQCVTYSECVSVALVI